MSLNSTPTAERVQIGIFGRVNAGKSSVMNSLTGQELAVVSRQEGTTTDPVRKAMELLPVGPVMVYDTPGLSDTSALGSKREQKTEEILRRIDMALIVVDAGLWKEGKSDGASAQVMERALLSRFQKQGIPCLVIANKMDTVPEEHRRALAGQIAQSLLVDREAVFPYSCMDPLPGGGVESLRERIAQLGKKEASEKRLVGDLLSQGDVILLVIPIDESAPKGRLILPQQQVIRDALDAGAVVMAAQPSELPQALARLKEAPRLVITDSQAFGEVSRMLPREVPLTSFSILMARYKGDLKGQAAGAKMIDMLGDGARILIAEGCTHHRQCGDIGTVKLPAWIKKHTGKEFQYSFTSGGEFPQNMSGNIVLQQKNAEKEGFSQHNDASGNEDQQSSGNAVSPENTTNADDGLADFDLIIHCGGCTLPEREMEWRIASAKEAGIPMTNYGTMIAYLHGILDRAMEPLAG